MLGSFANALLFVMGLVGSTILAVSVLSYTAHCILVVVTDTSAGVDRVRWPSDLMVDWIGQSLRFFGVVAILLIPVGVCFRAAADSLFPGEPGLRILVLGVPWLWFAFPIGLLSSMSAGTVYVVLRPAVVWD